jgi:hypothetical protein
MYVAFKYAVKKHKERQAQHNVEKDDQGDHEAQTTSGTAGTNVVVRTPETEAKAAKVEEKEKTNLSLEEAAEKRRRRSYRWQVIFGLCAPFLPLWAQLADIFGRHPAAQAAIVVMMVGSAICTGAPTSTFGILLFGRALQGVGAAGVNISIRTILADRVSLSDYALN